MQSVVLKRVEVVCTKAMLTVLRSATVRNFTSYKCNISSSTMVVYTPGTNARNYTTSGTQNESSMHKKGGETADAAMAAAKKGKDFVSGAAEKAYTQGKDAVAGVIYSNEAELHKQVDAVKSAAHKTKVAGEKVVHDAASSAKHSGEKLVESAKAHVKNTAASVKEFVAGAKDAVSSKMHD